MGEVEAEAPSSFSWRKMKIMEYYDVQNINECDVDAAQKLMELSDEEKSNRNNTVRDSSSSSRSKRFRRSSDEKHDIVMAKIQEIFGKDVEVFPMVKKQRRYRSLVNIYMSTTPVSDTRVSA
ncbi:uncharacterized protein LOC131607587 [Vicia villosa]|uniref:uncharacterized protein LOC131607587 n=1 Tax=Vicia villosa TaxID=3911 RepID=UPI00273CD3F3|nr:uncharacterized protein LOC131607587 [Vicia villosa]